jgi:threonine dehydratase
MATPDDLVSLDEIRAAHERIAPYVVRTPLVAMHPSRVWLKAESLQPSGAFKLRGAFNSLLSLGPNELAAGVVAHSSGNHAIAVAFAAAAIGVRAVIVMPHDAPSVKIERTRELGAEVVLVGSASSERTERAQALAASQGLSLVEPYDSRAVIAATGTITVELLEQARAIGGRVRALYVPISGGGLAAGVAAAAKALDADLRVVGVEPEVAADALASRRAGHIVTMSAEQMARTMADGLRVQRVGTLPWPHLEAFVDEIVTVSEQQIAAAMREAAAQARLVAEPSGATPVAAALAGLGSDGIQPAERAAVLCGGNVDLDFYARVLTGSDG